MRRGSIIGIAAGTATSERGGTRRGKAGVADRPRGRRTRIGLRPFSRSLRDPVGKRGRDAATSPERRGDEGRGGGPDVRRRRNARRGRDAAGSRNDGTERGRGSASDDHLIDTRRRDDEFVVVADVPGASVDDLSAGIDRRSNELVIGRNGDVLGRVDLPWESAEAVAVLFNNGVLGVRLRPGDR